MEVVVTTRVIRHAKLQVKSSPPTNQHPVSYRQDALPAAQQQCQSTEEKYLGPVAPTPLKGKLTSVGKWLYVKDNIKQITIQHIITRCHRIIVGYRAKF